MPIEDFEDGYRGVRLDDGSRVYVDGGTEDDEQPHWVREALSGEKSHLSTLEARRLIGAEQALELIQATLKRLQTVIRVSEDQLRRPDLSESVRTNATERRAKLRRAQEAFLDDVAAGGWNLRGS